MAVHHSLTILHLISLSVFYRSSSAMMLNEEYKISSPAEVVYFQMRDADSENLNIHVRTFGKTYDLELFKSPDVFSPAYEDYVARVDQDGNDVIEKIVVDQEDQIASSLYINDDGTASLSIQKWNGQLILEGILDHDVYITKREPTDRNFDDKIHHIAFRQPPVDRNSNCMAVNPDSQHESSDFVATPQINIPQPVQPEVLLAIEHKFSLYFNHNSTAIKQYLGIFFNSVNRRYKTIRYPKIKNVISGILLFTSPSAETFKVSVGSIVDGRATLSSFGKWLYVKRNAITTKYDVAMWITSLDLAFRTLIFYDKRISGIAYVGGACQQKMNVGLGEDKPGKYTGIHTVTHELAHLYGSDHDGQKANQPPGNPGSTKCSWNDGYIMSYVLNSTQKQYFSPCSAKSFEFTIGSASGSCLRDNPSHVEVPLKATLPGTQISLDQQCKANHGDKYYFYAPKINEVCVKRWCATKLGIFETFITSGPALEGSFCDAGNTKWCINGVCIPK